MNFPHMFLPEQGLSRNIAVLKRWNRVKPNRILTFHFDPNLWLSMVFSLGSRCSLAFYVEKTWDSWVPRTWVKEKLKRFVFSWADVIFCPGDDAVEYVARYRRSGSFRRLPHVVDVKGLSAASGLRESGNGLRLLYLGRFVEEKGLVDLMAAVDLLPLDVGISLHFAGSGPLLPVLEKWALRCALPVSIQGFVQHSEIIPVLAAADVLVFPTHGDPYGLVVDEAMASGMPVIASSSAGEISSRLVSGPAESRGVIVPPRDPVALAAAIDALAQDPATVARMKVAAEGYAESYSSIENWVHAIEEWCESPQPAGRH